MAQQPLTLPTVGVIQIDDDKKPADICDTCWKTVIANRLGLLSSPVVQEEILGPTSGGYAYKISGKLLKANADRKCRWCTLLVQVGKDSGSEGHHVLSVHVNDRVRWWGYVYTKEGDPAATYIPGRNLYVDVGTENALSLAEKLMQDCTDNHKNCPKPPESSAFLPSRVIDCNDPDHPRLHISTKEQRDRYVILSYVWGEDIPHKLTKDNLETYKRGIPLKDQPQTIRDAILTTRRLGLQYLWIDCLCIIQDGDNDEDKGRELQRMRSYYKDSHLAVIAASASKVSEGFLQARKDTYSDLSLALPFVIPDGKSLGVVYLYSWIAGKGKYEPEREPIHGRGWCMQEYFLSPRELIFATPTLQYHCHQGTRNIAGADNAHWISSEREPVPSRDLPKDPKTNEEKRQIQKAWKLAIENYTKRKISHSNDKLVALASLAEEFHDAVKSPYHAGLWEKTLLFDLLWSKESAKHYFPRPAEYRAPSWSWASLDGEINPGNSYFSEKEELVAEVKKCETTPKDPKLPFGEVTAATLVLNAKVVVDCVMKPHWAIYHLRDKNESGPDNEWIDDESGRRMEEIGLGKLDCSAEDIHSGVRHVSVVLVGRLDDITDPGTRAIQGLLVEPLSPGTSAGAATKYRRIGFFERRGEMREVDEWFDKLTKIEIEIV